MRGTKVGEQLTAGCSSTLYVAVQQDRPRTLVQLEPIWDARTRAACGWARGPLPRQESLTVFSRTDRTARDHGVSAGHLAGR
jgi:hypothetical protein